MVEGVLVIDARGNILLMNPTLKNLLHLSQETGGKNTLEVVRNIKVQEMIEKVLKNPQGIEVEEISFLLPEEKIFAVHATLIVREGAAEGVVAIFHDITELRRLEQVRREFVANVSHELRTPLASIKGYAETLLDGALGDPENAKDFLKIIHSDADRLARLINDILDLSKIESGNLKMDFRPVAMQTVIERVIEGLKK